jgi:RNA polymerase sigma-70 factor (ECF subfamily)
VVARSLPVLGRVLRVTISNETPEAIRFQVEGKLNGEVCAELREAYGRLAGGEKRFLVDLSGLTFIDGAGTMLIGELLREPNELVACSEYAQAILERHATTTRHNASLPGDLLARLRRGDEDAFETLVRQHGGRMLAVARRFLTCEADALDVLQEAFIAAYKSIGDFKGDSSLATWLHRIVVNAALMNLRSKRRRAVEPIDDLLPRFDRQGSWADGSDGAAQLPLQSLEQKQTRAMVRRNIERLPEAYRLVLILRDIEELDTAEVATKLAISENAVKIRLHRGHQALKTLIARDQESCSAKFA